MNINIETLRKVKGIGSKTMERILKQHLIDTENYVSKYVPSETYKIKDDITLWNGDCLALMHHIPDKSVDMVLCDLPYGTTACSWDIIIPFNKLWAHYNRIIKDNGAVVLFGSEPFSTKLRSSNLEWYKYDWVWKKNSVSNPQSAKFMPLKNIETISVFGPGRTIYNPQGLIKLDKPKIVKGKGVSDTELLRHTPRGSYVQTHTNYPRMILEFSRDSRTLHPTQKPVKLLEYLIKTYTDEGMIVLDNTMGSGSTGVAAKRTNRRFIGIEMDTEYYNIAIKRINEGD